MSKTNNNTQEKERTSFLLFPIIAVLAVVPLILRVYVYDNKLTEYPWYIFNNTSVDVFLYWKSIAFIVITAFMLVILAYRLLMKKQKFMFSYAFVPLGIYLVFILLSSLFSENRYFSLHGITDQFESMFVLIGYTIAVVYGFHMVKKESDVRNIMKWFSVGILILCIIGFFQFIQHDLLGMLLSSDFGRSLLIPEKYREVLSDFSLVFGKGMVYLCQYNPNYVGVYVSLLIPMIVVFALFAKKFKSVIVSVVMILGLILCLFGSRSKSGLISIGVSMLFLCFFLRKNILKHWKIMIGALILLIAGFIGVNAVSGNVYLDSLKNMLKPATAIAGLENIETNDSNITIHYKQNKLIASYTVDANQEVIFDLKDGEGNAVNYVYDEQTAALLIQDERFAGFAANMVSAGQEGCISIKFTIDGADWVFTNQLGDGTYYFYNIRGRWDKIKQADAAVFTNHESLATGRGYIWSRTIPLLKNNLILGSGADTFTLEFPQDDYVGLTRNNFNTSIMTKPHNMYLQIAVQTGVLSLLAFLCFYGIYMIGSIRLYWNCRFDNYMSQTGAAIFIGTIGYMVSGLSNDSTITVSPLFWMLSGIGLAVNHYVKQQSKA